MFIKVSNAVKKYGSGDATVYALNGVEFTLEKGKMCVILGPSGSGKSTLLNMIGGIDTLTDGEIIVGDKNISKMNRKELTEYRREMIGFVFQFYNLIGDLSVKENIQIVSDISKNPLNIDEIIGNLDIEKLKNRFPKELSGGQQQRVAIARAMIKNPQLLLCDELTGALDSSASRDVLNAIEKLNKTYGTTIIIITHNQAIAQMADVIVSIKDGRIVGNRENLNKVSANEITL